MAAGVGAAVAVGSFAIDMVGNVSGEDDIMTEVDEIDKGKGYFYVEKPKAEVGGQAFLTGFTLGLYALRTKIIRVGVWGLDATGVEILSSFFKLHGGISLKQVLETLGRNYRIPSDTIERKDVGVKQMSVVFKAVRV